MRLSGIMFLLLLILSGSLATAQTPERPLILPMAAPPGPSTWLLGQPYGNTIGAYNFGTQWYSAGQGLHFGIDFSMPCGTALVAVANGRVAFVDNLSYGAGPHNLLIRHDDLGIISLYGHLQDRAPLVEGQAVSQGQFVALSGDPDSTCDSRPHLHFEIRSLDYRTTYNPVPYIDANWHSLALIGGFSYPMFQQDLENSRRWLTLEDQPDVAFGGARLNSYGFPWPPGFNLLPPSNPMLLRPYIPLGDNTTTTLRRIGFDRCCWRRWWHPIDGTRLYVIDGSAGSRAAYYEWLPADGQISQLVSAAPPPFWSPDASHTLLYANGVISIQRSLDGALWQVNTGGSVPAISTDNSQLLWIMRDGVAVPGQSAPGTRLFVSSITGENVRQIEVEAGANANWLDATRILISSRQQQNTTLSIYDTADDSRFILGEWNSIRGISVSPGGRYLSFYQTWQSDVLQNAVYLIETQPNALPTRMPWFGAWRWRDAESLYYIPFNPASENHQLMYFHITTGEQRPLTDPAVQPFTVMNGDWDVSADGRLMVFQNAADGEMWLMEIAAN